MDNYKIKVKDESVAKESRELFKQLGYKPDNSTFDTYVTWVAVFEDGSGSFYGSDIHLDECKEITIANLRDLVVLKRNDVRDATHTDRDEFNEYLYINLNGVWYYQPKSGGGWKESCNSEIWHTKNLSTIKKTKEKDQGLISGAEALRALADGKEVQWISKDFPKWDDIDIWNANTRSFLNEEFIVESGFKYRLKPQTIKLELEIPAPFDPKDGDICFVIDADQTEGFRSFIYRADSDFHKKYIQFGAWRTEEDVKQVVEQLRKLRGNNS